MKMKLAWSLFTLGRFVRRRQSVHRLRPANSQFQDRQVTEQCVSNSILLTPTCGGIAA